MSICDQTMESRVLMPKVIYESLQHPKHVKHEDFKRLKSYSGWGI